MQIGPIAVDEPEGRGHADADEAEEDEDRPPARDLGKERGRRPHEDDGDLRRDRSAEPTAERDDAARHAALRGRNPAADDAGAGGVGSRLEEPAPEAVGEHVPEAEGEPHQDGAGRPGEDQEGQDAARSEAIREPAAADLAERVGEVEGADEPGELRLVETERRHDLVGRVADGVAVDVEKHGDGQRHRHDDVADACGFFEGRRVARLGRHGVPPGSRFASSDSSFSTISR